MELVNMSRMRSDAYCKREHYSQPGLHLLNFSGNRLRSCQQLQIICKEEKNNIYKEKSELLVAFVKRASSLFYVF